MNSGGLTVLFPTDLTSFLDLMRQHGEAAYSFIFAYASSHSLLLALFAGYAASSGALNFGALIMVWNLWRTVYPKESIAPLGQPALVPAE